ncbi:Flagellar hook-associated protein flgK [Actinacidiphila cocklensis]|uniref:Flagellar hook-associated protein flgK n=1 Tax=Actinacidiphila cocklensis TaxID=887465 RepID=A0A9W4DL90_9ACTN|nr:Flagellar hook-associated protein flgK [Actinacidiphila cocklensis]
MDVDETGTIGGTFAAAGEVEVVLTLAAAGTAEDDLRSLLRWLRADESLAGRAAGRIRDGAPPQPGAMGLAFDVLQLTIGSGLSAGALAVSLAQWRDARRRPPGITLRRGQTTVEIPASGPVDVAALTRALQFLGTQPQADLPLPAAAPLAAAPPDAHPPPVPAQGPTRAAIVRAGEAAGDGTPS